MASLQFKGSSSRPNARGLAKTMSERQLLVKFVMQIREGAGLSAADSGVISR